MSHTIQQLATLANVSVRTLHYYDEIGLLKPKRSSANGYRRYEREELLKLQQILFFRELDFSLGEIHKILSSPSFSMKVALSEQKKLLKLKQKRLNGLIRTIDTTLHTLHHHTSMNDQNLYSSFDSEEIKAYAEEARRRWGHTDAYQQSKQRTAKMTKSDFARIAEENDKLMKKIVACMGGGPMSREVQTLIAQHYQNLRHFYEPNLELYRGLANMYVDDARFAANYEKYSEGLAVFMRDAMLFYCEQASSDEGCADGDAGAEDEKKAKKKS